MSSFNSLLEKYENLFSSGISSDSFVGEDVRYSSDFEAIQTILADSVSLYTTGKTDWDKILELSQKILSEQSKDMRVLTWFTWALFKTSSFLGLHTGLTITYKLTTAHWETLLPTRERTRISSIEWLFSRLEQLFQEPLPVKDQLPLFKVIAEDLNQLNSFLSEKWGDKSPLILPTCRRLDRMIQEAALDPAEQSANPIVKTISQVKEVASQVIGLSSSPSTIENEKDANKTLRNLQESSRSLSTWWLSQKATDIKALRLNRTLLWVGIETIPEHKNQITSLRPVPSDKINNYKDRLTQGRYADLLTDLETSISKAPFWLDGQYMVWQCLRELNAESAQHEVEVQLALFLHKVPEIVDLKFHGGLPFASEETRQWIDDHVLPWQQKNKTTQTSLVDFSSSSQEWDDVLKKCLINLPKNGLKESLKPLIDGLKAAHGERERFFWHLCMAKVCFANKQYELAKSKLESLDEQFQQLNLQKWEPTLALEVVFLLYRCCELLPQTQLVRETKDKLHKRLCYLDLNLVLDEK